MHVYYTLRKTDMSASLDQNWNGPNVAMVKHKQKIRKLDSLPHCPNVVAQRDILGVCTQGAVTPKLELGGDFCTMHLHPNFIFLCLLVRKLSYWETNKQTDADENTQRSSLRYDVG